MKLNEDKGPKLRTAKFLAVREAYISDVLLVEFGGGGGGGGGNGLFLARGDLGEGVTIHFLPVLCVCVCGGG